MRHIAPVYDRNSGRIEEDAWRRADRYPQGGTHQGFNRPDVRDKRNILIGMSQGKLLHTGADALLHCYHALTTGRSESRIALPLVKMLGVFGTARQDFSAIHALPYTETAFPQRVNFLNGEVVAFGDGYGCGVGALHWAAINGGDVKYCQRFRHLRGLHLPVFA